MGIVEDCCCDYETVNSINEEVLHPILQELVTTPFFRYFKVKQRNLAFHIFISYNFVNFELSVHQSYLFFLILPGY